MDFFRDARSYNERQSVMVRVLYHQPLAFEAKEVRLEKGKDRAQKTCCCLINPCCCDCCYGSGDSQY